jgi:hypothetical protein
MNYKKIYPFLIVFFIIITLISLKLFFVLQEKKDYKSNPHQQYVERNLNISENIINQTDNNQDTNKTKSIENTKQQNSCLLQNGTEIICKDTQECKNGNCVLAPQSKKYGVLYIYESQNTYNSNWQQNLEEDFLKTYKTLLDLTNNRINYSFDILGEMKTTEFCWNPAFLGINQTQEIISINITNNEIISQESINIISPLPGSGFGTNTQVIDSTKRKEGNLFKIERPKDLKLDCPSCKIYYKNRTEEFQELFPEKNFIDVNTTYIEIDCINNVVEQKFNSSLLEELKLRASNELNFDLEGYDEIIVIFGNLGRILPRESEINHKFRCKTAIGFIGGYSSLIFAENELKSEGDFVECIEDSYSGNTWYEPTGWHILVHEFLHHFGAVDIYDTGTIFGYNSPAYNRQKALEIDSRADESVMGNSDRACKQLTQETKKDECSNSEIERVYLDKYNKRLIGIE